jgi:hypothetical protein
MGTNNPTVNPYYLGQAATGIGSKNVFMIQNIEWVNPLTAGHRAYFYDSFGAVICDFICVTPHLNLYKWFRETGMDFTGPLTLANLDSGYLLVQLF